MCEICESVELRKVFLNAEDYLECLDYIQFLVDDGDFVFVTKDCEIDKVKNKNGYWINDVIKHVIQCKMCGQYFTCTGLTYRGGGEFGKGIK